jgi:hypothetical protein
LGYARGTNKKEAGVRCQLLRFQVLINLREGI